MAFNSSIARDGHTIVGSGNRGFGRHHYSSSLLYTPPLYHTYHSSPYYGTTYYGGSGRHGILGGGITLLVLGVALAALGVFSFVIGDPPLGVAFTAIGGLGIIAGLACIIARFANKKFN